MKRKGFTLIELIVVMAIIAILVLLAAPKYLNYIKDAHVTAMQQDAKVLQNIALGYNVKHNGVYPATELKDETELTTLGTVTLAQINKAITETGIEDDLAATDLATFNKEVSGSLQGLKNELEDYVIVVKGPHAGEVVFIDSILTNSDGVQYISLEPAKAELK